MLDTVIRILTPILGLALLALLISVLVDRIPPPRWLSKKAQLTGLKNPESITSHECPYAYLRQIYGKHHWAPFVHKLSPSLKTNDPAKYTMVLEIMDAIHLCLMLVDDVCPSFHFPLRSLGTLTGKRTRCPNRATTKCRSPTAATSAKANPPHIRSTVPRKPPTARITASRRS